MLEFIALDQIKLRPDRQRKIPAPDHIQSLAESIRQNGLFHAPVLNMAGELIAGECRRQAILHLHTFNQEFEYNGKPVPKNCVPIVRTSKTTASDLFRIELEENIRRKNLSQMEEALAIAKLHELGKSNDPSWTNRDTAGQLAELREQSSLGANEAEVAQALILAQFADDPEVKAAKTKASAVRIAKRKLEQEFRSSLGIESTDSIQKGFEVIHGNSLQVLATIPDLSYDGIVTDPPYGIDADAFGGASFLGAEHQYADDAKYALSCYEVLAREGFRICALEAHAYVFCDILMFPAVKLIFETEGWAVWKTPIIWSKGSVGHSPRPEYGPKRSYETILFANKGSRRIVKMGSDVIDISTVYAGDKLHAAQKPEELLAVLMSWSFLPGSRVLDPFCGSGSIFPAANEMGIAATGIELDEKNVGISRDRISRL